MGVNSYHRSERPDESVPYVMERYPGQRTNLGGDVIWTPAGGDETDGKFAIAQTTSTKADRPITPMHWHDDEHDAFVCLRGALKVWADGESRILRPGDFASVPPGVPHSYQPVGPRTEFVGIIDTGGWEEFFFEGGETHDGELYTEKVDLDEERFGKVAAKYGVNLAEQAYPDPDFEAQDHELPSAHESYFLESGYGPQYALGGTLATVLCGEAETDGSFGIVTYEGPEGTGLPTHHHDKAAKVVYVLEGEITGDLGGKTYEATGGEYVNVPPGTSFSYEATNGYTRLIVFTSGSSAHRLAEVAGEPRDHYRNPDPSESLDANTLATMTSDIDVVFK